MRLSKMRLTQRLSKAKSPRFLPGKARSPCIPARPTATPWFANVAVFPDGSVVWNPSWSSAVVERGRSQLPIPESLQPKVIQPKVIQPESLQPKVIQPEIIQPELLSLQAEFVPLFIPFDALDYKATVTVEFIEV